MPAFPKPPAKDLVYEDRDTFACVASAPFAKGHVIVAWKKDVADLHELHCKEFDRLMAVVDAIRDAILLAYGTDKVYLFYMDELRHVHWHLIPRLGKMTGFKLVVGPAAAGAKKDPRAAVVLREAMRKVLPEHKELGKKTNRK